MVTDKTGTVNVSRASDLGCTLIVFGTAGDVNWSDKLSRPTQVENDAAAPGTPVSPARAGFDTATPEKIAEASSKIVEGVKAALAHGFNQVTACDGTKAIEVKITRTNGEEVTYLLSEGARGTRYQELAGYGNHKLNGATLVSYLDFVAVVDSLLEAIRGLKEVRGVLQAEDAALKKAHQIVSEGVRRDGGFSWVVFDLDDRGAVAGRRIFGGGSGWVDGGYRCYCALFGASPAESKKS
jgi:hypothetical protein